MRDSVPLKTFARKFESYCPDFSYNKARRWAKANKLPIWPRLKNENFYVKVQDLKPFCLAIGLSEADFEAFYSDLTQ